MDNKTSVCDSLFCFSLFGLSWVRKSVGGLEFTLPAHTQTHVRTSQCAVLNVETQQGPPR